MVMITIGVGKRDFGAIECIGLAVFMATLMPSLIRVSYQYSIAQDGPGEKPLPQGVVDTFVTNTHKTRRFSQKMVNEAGQRFSHIQQRQSVLRTSSAFSKEEVLDMHKHIGSRGIPHMIGSQLSILGFMSQDIQEQIFMVDNRELKAKTVGLGYRLSPKLTDLDTKANGFRNLAPWGSMVKGVPCGPNWVKVGKRFLPRHLDEVEVLILQEKVEDDEEGSETEEQAKANQFNMKFFKELFLGPPDQGPIWEGCTKQERTRRISSVLKRSTQTILGIAIAGVIVGCGMVPLRMQALSQIGLASLCASLTLPPMVLGLMPILISMGFGPTRVRRRALAQFARWVHAGRPRGFDPDSDVGTGSKGISSEKMVPMKSVMSKESLDSVASEHDWRAPGEIAAEELGFPYTLALRHLTDHFPVSSFPSQSAGGDDPETTPSYETYDVEMTSPDSPQTDNVVSPSSSAIQTAKLKDRWDTPPTSSETPLTLKIHSPQPFAGDSSARG